MTTPSAAVYDGIILAVPHDGYRKAGVDALRAYGRPGHLFFDLKSIFPAEASDLRL